MADQNENVTIAEKIDLSIIIPCYNESHRIVSTLEQTFDFLDSQPFTYEIRVVDDASPDNCVALMKERFQRQNFHIHTLPRNLGKGNSIRIGFDAARGEYVMFMDADLAVPVEEILNLLDELKNGHDVVVGIRIFEVNNTSRFRRVIGFALLLYANLVLPLPQVSDTQCGFKGFNRKAAKYISGKMRIKRGMFDIEMLLIASIAGLKIKSIPVPWGDRPGSTIRLFRCLVRDPVDILKIRLNSLLRKYNRDEN